MSVPDFIALVSGLTGVISAVGAIVINIQQNKKNAALLDYRMSLVEHKLDEHNGYASRFSEIEKAIVAMQKDIEYIKNK